MRTGRIKTVERRLGESGYGKTERHRPLVSATGEPRNHLTTDTRETVRVDFHPDAGLCRVGAYNSTDAHSSSLWGQRPIHVAVVMIPGCGKYNPGGKHFENRKDGSQRVR